MQRTFEICDLKADAGKLEQHALALYELTLLANEGHSSWKAASFLSELKDKHSLYTGCMEENKLAGYICCMAVVDEASINNFAVAPHQQGKGIGTKLLQEMIALLKTKGMERLWLEVRVSNEAAYTLYKKIGFTEIFRRKDYYQNPIEDAYIMELALTSENIEEAKGC